MLLSYLCHSREVEHESSRRHGVSCCHGEAASSVKETAKTFLERKISAAPVVDDHGKLVGIISEGDLIHRSEAGTERQRPRWLESFISNETLAAEYTKAHARKVADIMTRHVITAEPDSPLHEIAALLEKNAIKRVPIVKDGQLVGIVSRANLVQAVASAKKALEVSLSIRRFATNS
jgi:CBS domain-containing protein